MEVVGNGKTGQIYGIVICPQTYLYKENLTEISDELFMGWAVEIQEEAEDYYRAATHYGYEGYIRRDTVKLTDAAALMKRDKSGEMCFIRHSAVDVMAIPRVQGKILFTLCRGSFVQRFPKRQDCRCINGYQLIETSDGTVGYVPEIALSPRLDNDGYLYTCRREDYFLRQMRHRTGNEEKLRKSLVSCAKTYLGVQYRWGGKSTEGLDCSGLTFMSYQMNGILIYRDAELRQEYPVREIPFSMAGPGDLLYFPGHIAMYLGDGKFIHSTAYRKSFACVINSLFPEDRDYRPDLAGKLTAVGSIFWERQN